jgi:toxin ParE1/3/4
MKPPVFNHFAEQELVDAVDYYEAAQAGLGLRYLQEVEYLIQLLVEFPEMGVVIQGSIRRLVLPKFPYSLLYRVLDDRQIRILAVAHHKQRPRYWVNRK